MRLALFAVVLPVVAFAQETPPANDNVEKPPAETVTPPTDQQQPPAQTETPPPTEQKADAQPQEDDDDDDHGGKRWGKWGHGWGNHWGAHKKHDGQGWGDVRPWRIAVEGGGAFGLGLNAQVTYRSRWGMAIGLGAIGFGQNSVEDRFGRDDDGPRADADVRQGYYLSLARYRGGWGRGGFFAGAKLGAAETILTAADGTTDRLWAGFINPEIGYQWFPFQRSLFIRPSVGATLVVARWGGTPGAPVPPFIVPSATLTLGFAL